MLRKKSIFKSRAELEAYVSCVCMGFLSNAGLVDRRANETDEERTKRVTDHIITLQDIVFSAAEEYAVLVYAQGEERIPAQREDGSFVTDANVDETRKTVVDSLKESCKSLGIDFDELVKVKGAKYDSDVNEDKEDDEEE